MKTFSSLFQSVIYLYSFSGERKKYYKHQKKAEQRPDKYLSLIIDGMDQSKTHLPHWIQKSKVRISSLDIVIGVEAKEKLIPA